MLTKEEKEKFSVLMEEAIYNQPQPPYSVIPSIIRSLDNPIEDLKDIEELLATENRRLKSQAIAVADSREAVFIHLKHAIEQSKWRK